jgi:hypothetical protein
MNSSSAILLFICFFSSRLLLPLIQVKIDAKSLPQQKRGLVLSSPSAELRVVRSNSARVHGGSFKKTCHQICPCSLAQWSSRTPPGFESPSRCKVLALCTSLRCSRQILMRIVNIWHCHSRVARWFVFKPKLKFWVNFGGSCNGICWYILWTLGQIYGLLLYVMDIWCSSW